MAATKDNSGVYKIPALRINSMRLIETLDTENLSFRILNGFLDMIENIENMAQNDNSSHALKELKKLHDLILSKDDEYYNTFFDLMRIIPHEKKAIRKVLVAKTIQAIELKEDRISNMFRFILSTLLDFYEYELEWNEANMLIVTETNDFIERISDDTGIDRYLLEKIILFRLTEK